MRAIFTFSLVTAVVMGLSGHAAAARAMQQPDCNTKTVAVLGGSMVPRIPSGARIEIATGEPQCIDPLGHGDIVTINSGARDIPLLKAIRAVPGDRFSVSRGHIFVNGRLLANTSGIPYSLNRERARMIDLYARDYGSVIPDDTFLVMGEDPRGTTDSSMFGLVHRTDITGKAILHDAADGSEFENQNDKKKDETAWSTKNVDLH